MCIRDRATIDDLSGCHLYADERQHGLNFRGHGRPEAAWGADVLLPGAQPPVQVRSGMALLRFVVDVVGGGGGGVAVVGLASIFVRRVISHPSPFLTYVCKKAAFDAWFCLHRPWFSTTSIVFMHTFARCVPPAARHNGELFVASSPISNEHAVWFRPESADLLCHHAPVSPSHPATYIPVFATLLHVVRTRMN